MIKILRIWAIITRHLIPMFRDPIRITDMAYYPLVDIILFGFLAVWAHEGTVKPDNFIFAFLNCVACWYLIYRSALEISRNLLIEIWDGHLVNLLAGPLSITELMISLMIIGFLQAFITFIYSGFVIWLIFGKNIFATIPLIFPYLPLFIVFGWIVGILTAALILYFGKNFEFVTWAFPWFFALLSGAYYSLELFPMWIQKVAALIPASYLFTGVRETINSGKIVPNNLLMGIILSIIYFFLVFKLLLWMFNKSKENGLNNLE